MGWCEMKPINPIKMWFTTHQANKRADEIYLRNKELGEEMKHNIHKQGQLTEQQRDYYLKELTDMKNELDRLNKITIKVKK